MNVAPALPECAFDDFVDTVLGRVASVIRGARVAKGFFFMRKPPGLRLRLLVEPGSGEAEAAISGVLQALRREGVVRRHYPSCYEPEVFQFGGAEAMAAVHALFQADTALYLRWAEARRAGRSALGAEVLSLATMNDLFLRVLGDSREETWDVWCNVATLHALGPCEGPTTVPPITIGDLARIARWTQADRALLRAAASSNRLFARRFESLHRRGKLRWAHRLVLPYIAIFHWNRFGMSETSRARMLGAMTSAFSPKHLPNHSHESRPDRLTTS